MVGVSMNIIANLKSIGLIVLVSVLAYLYVQNNQLETSLANSQRQAKAQSITIVGMTAQIAKNKQLDNNLQQELSSERNKIDVLDNYIERDPSRLRVTTANCPMPNITTTASVVDATAAKSTEKLRQDYIRLRQEIVTVNTQIKGLQGYINNLPIECVTR